MTACRLTKSSLMAIYFASVNDRATAVDFVDFQETAAPA
jgi:hypothetical protein